MVVRLFEERHEGLKDSMYCGTARDCLGQIAHSFTTLGTFTLQAHDRGLVSA